MRVYFGSNGSILQIFASILILIVSICLLQMPSIADDTLDKSKSSIDILNRLTDISIEDLMNIKITSVAKRAEKVSDSAAAVYVITQEDIRRSGLNSIPDLLRMVPGLQVANIDSNKWAISSRGLADRFANKLLVLIDGRSAYTPLFSGVWWDVQDVLLEDIDRIEIIRGPGASLWGTNAVNGIINIITKSAMQTSASPLTVALRTGNGNQGSISLNGGSDDAAYRVYAKLTDNGNFVDSLGNDENDSWHRQMVGFRIDRKLHDNDSITMQGDAYSGIEDQTLIMPFLEPFVDHGKVSGGNYLTRLTRDFSDGSSVQLQFYFDRTLRKDGMHSEARNTFDLDFQHNFNKGSRQEFVWGLGYRNSKDNFTGNINMQVDPTRQTQSFFSGFIQDDISIIPDKLKLTLGTKIEHNSFTGFEIQPNARVLWQPSAQQTVWTALSRAARIPSRFERDVTLWNWMILPEVTIQGMPVLVSVTGNPDMKAENLTAYELGYRFQPSERLSFDAAAFYNNYDNHRSFDGSDPAFELLPTPHIVFPITIHNRMGIRSSGLELLVNCKPTDNWKFTAGWSYIDINMNPSATSNEMVQDYGPAVPRNQLQIRSYLDLPGNFELDTMIYYIGEVRANNASPGYTRLDLRLGWQSDNGPEISVGVQNLLESHHNEFYGSLNEKPTEAPRTIYGKVTWQF